jgi:hypothetical protein
MGNFISYCTGLYRLPGSLQIEPESESDSDSDNDLTLPSHHYKSARCLESTDSIR